MNAQPTSVIAVRISGEIISALDRIAEAAPEGRDFGRRVTRADIIRRALAREVAEHAPAVPAARARTR